MGLLSRLRGWIMNFFTTQAKEKFKVQTITSERMETAQRIWYQILKGNPPWVTDDGDIRTINFARFVCTFLAKNTCLDLKITVQGSERADYINKVLGLAVQKTIRDKVEDALGLGGMIIKPTGTYDPDSALDFIMPGWFAVTDTNTNGDILGAVFIDRREKGDLIYSRLEYHHFIDADDGNGTEGEPSGDAASGQLYEIQQKAYVSRSRDALGREIPLTEVAEWAHLQPVTRIDNVEHPLFAYFRCPVNNTIDFSSPEGVPIFDNAIEELENLDIAWSQKRNETADSTHITFIDDTAIRKPGTVTKDNPAGERIKLPRFVQGIRKGVDSGQQTVTEHVPTMLTEQRIADINSILSMISTKVGCSQGQFTLDRKTGVITATQVESDDKETIDTVADIRAQLEAAIKQLIYALDKYCDAIFEMPSGYVNALDEDVDDKEVFYFKDLQETFEQDRTRAYQLMVQGIISKKRYLMQYEGFTEEEADEEMQQAQEEREASMASQQLFSAPMQRTGGSGGQQGAGSGQQKSAGNGATGSQKASKSQNTGK